MRYEVHRQMSQREIQVIVGWIDHLQEPIATTITQPPDAFALLVYG
jgi:hypothetical protein